MLKLWIKYKSKNNLSKLIILVILVKLLGFILPFEFSNITFREGFSFCVTNLLVIAIFIKILIEVVSEKSNLKIGIRVLLSIPIVIIFLVLEFMISLFGFMCASGENVIYSKRNSYAVIVNERYDCGATTDYTYKTYYVYPLTPLFNFKWAFDTDNLDKSNWFNPNVENVKIEYPPEEIFKFKK